MDDFISKAAFLDAMIKRYHQQPCVGIPYSEKWELLKDALEEHPAANVREVKRGEWVRVDYEPCGHDYVCSECGEKNDRASKFCPCCGADMRKEEQT